MHLFPTPARVPGSLLRRATVVALVAGLLVALTSAHPATAADGVAFRDAVAVNDNAVSLRAPLPEATQAGDTMVLLATANRSEVSISTPAGWERLDRVVHDSMQSLAFVRVAKDGDRSVEVEASERAKMDLQVLSYDGASASNPIVAHAVAGESRNTTDHTTPVVTTTAPGDRVVSYWADKTSETTAWDTPSTVAARQVSVGSSYGRITSVAADAPAPGEAAGGIEASSSSADDKAVMWTIVLRAEERGDETPEPPEPPTAPDGVVRWDMDEPAGASSMLALDADDPVGEIGSEVVSGIAVGTGVGYRFPYADPTDTTQIPGRLVTVDDDPAVEPGADTFRVSIRMATTRNFGNVLQKGQATTRGGMFKMQIENRKVQCLFRDGQGRAVGVGTGGLLDGQPHVITCTKERGMVTMIVDGELVAQGIGTVGAIDNHAPFTIGGKPWCASARVQCDYFTGVVDWVEVERN